MKTGDIWYDPDCLDEWIYEGSKWCRLRDGLESIEHPGVNIQSLPIKVNAKNGPRGWFVSEIIGLTIVNSRTAVVARKQDSLFWINLEKRL